MSYHRNFRVPIILLTLGLLLTACHPGGGIPNEIQESPQNWDPCATTPDMGFNLESVASAPALISPEDTPALGALGAHGAQALAALLQPQDTFCDAEAPGVFQEILEKARELADQGDKEGARRLLESLLEIGSHPGGGYLLSLRFQTPEQARSLIAGYLAAAGLDLALGGDGQVFIDQAQAAFTELANSELNSASLDETMRLMEEALRLGQEEIAQRALKRAQDIAGEGLDAAIEDFNPCLSNPEDLKDEITKLLQALQTAMLLGVPGTNGPGGGRYDATWSQASAALQTLMGETPDECKGFSFQFTRTVSGSVTMTGEAHTCGDIRGPWEGTLQLAGTWTDFGNTGEVSGTFEFTIPEDKDEVEAIIQTSGRINSDEGCYIPYSDPLQLRVHLVGEQELELGIVSVYAGTASIVCPEGSEGLPGISTVWTEEPTFAVELTPGAECP